jgi:hypothetical protein
VEIAADLVCADPSDAMWATAYPRVAQGFSRQRVRQVLLELRDTLQPPQTSVPPTSHGRLLAECLSCHIEDRNDAPAPQVITALKAARVAQDAASRAWPRVRQGRERVSIDFAAFLDMYCWDIDVLIEASTYAQLGAATKQPLGDRADGCGGLSGRLPHPAARALQTVEEVETTEPGGGAGAEKLSARGRRPVRLLAGRADSAPPGRRVAARACRAASS